MGQARRPSGMTPWLAVAFLLVVQQPSTAAGAAGDDEVALAAAAAARRSVLDTDDACGASLDSSGDGGAHGGTCAMSALQMESSGRRGGEQTEQASRFRREPTSPLEGCQGIDCISQYIALDDGQFAWRDTGARLQGMDAETSMPWKGYVLNVTSQRWLSEAEIDNPLWWHTVMVIVPEQIEFQDWVTLNLGFGYYTEENLTRIDNRHAYSRAHDGLGPSVEITADNLFSSLAELKNAARVAAYTAVRTKALAACLLDVPNGYEVFSSDPTHFRRSADFLKGYSYGEFLQHPSRPELIDELPVAKAVVMAMDAITAFAQETIPEAKVDRFGLVGYSKLGTATFITAAVDERVKAIAPGAIFIDWKDVLEEPPPPVASLLSKPSPFEQLGSMDNETLGKFAAQASYALMYIDKGTPQFAKLTSIIDPINWLDRLTMPKLYIMSSNDQVLPFQTLTSPSRQLKSFRGPTSFLQQPNSAHDGTINHALPSVAAFFRGVLLNKPAPELDWQLDDATGKITARVASDAPPVVRAKLWVGETSGLMSSGFADSPFRAEDLQEVAPGSGVFETELAAPPAPSGVDDDPSSAGTFVQFEFVWPEPGFNFTISTPMWLSASA